MIANFCVDSTKRVIKEIDICLPVYCPVMNKKVYCSVTSIINRPLRWDKVSLIELWYKMQLYLSVKCPAKIYIKGWCRLQKQCSMFKYTIPNVNLPSCYIYLARLILAFWPPLRDNPLSPTSVRSPFTMISISWHANILIAHQLAFYLNSVELSQLNTQCNALGDTFVHCYHCLTVKPQTSSGYQLKYGALYMYVQISRNNGLSSINEMLLLLTLTKAQIFRTCSYLGKSMASPKSMLSLRVPENTQASCGTYIKEPFRFISPSVTGIWSNIASSREDWTK